MVKALPPEVTFGTVIIGDSAFLTFDDIRFYKNFFPGKNDGFALDIINQDQYQCDNVTRLAGSFSHKGFLLEPVYRDDIPKRMKVRDRAVYIFGGLVPRNFDRKKIEANYMLLEDRYQCNYTSVVHVGSDAWDLLPMGLYYDTLKGETIEDRYKDLEKNLKFTIPFEKNTSVYKKEDIKPLYDSLKLTDYAITFIRIRAFTSVEGSLKRNIELQDERAQSIVSALQAYQPESIKSEITSNENWVEFMDAVVNTPYKSLAGKSKDEIKEALKDPTTADKLEPLLAKERKAIVELVLEKRVKYSKSTAAELKTYFDQSVSKKDVNEALYIQEIIFHKIKRQELPDTFLKDLEIPKTLEFGSLLLNYASFIYEQKYIDTFQALKAFTALNEILGENPKVNYNIIALQLKAWTSMKHIPIDDGLRKKIEDLGKQGISKQLVLRLLINYNLIRAEITYEGGNTAEREKSIRFVYDQYKRLKLTDTDLLSVARFMSFNSRFPLAREVLRPRTKALDASENLLFYYIGLTMYDKRNTSSQAYRTFLLNIVNSNRTRFCQLFTPVPQGGITFQLLEDEFLKKTWCENCNLSN